MTSHPFAAILKILGAGKTSSRSLTLAESEQAFEMIFTGQATAAQIGALLMLLRVKEETAEELAGSVLAARKLIQPPAIAVDIDLSSYAGKSKQQPWFVLSALLLADNGLRVFIHGNRGLSDTRLYTEDVFQTLGLPIANSWQNAREQLEQHGVSFFALDKWFAPLQQLMDLRAELGVRLPVHTLARLINPLNARASLQSIFHPAYAQHHHRAAQILGHTHAVVFKGDSGECDIRPQADARLLFLHHGESTEQLWPRTLNERPQPQVLDAQLLKHLWCGQLRDNYGEQAVIGSAALMLATLHPELTRDDAFATATQYWQARNRDRL